MKWEKQSGKFYAKYTDGKIELIANYNGEYSGKKGDKFFAYGKKNSFEAAKKAIESRYIQYKMNESDRQNKGISTTVSDT